MKRTIFTLAAIASLSATPAFAGLTHEVASDNAAPVQLVASPQFTKGSGALVTSETDGNAATAIGSVRLAPYPQAERPINRGR